MPVAVRTRSLAEMLALPLAEILAAGDYDYEPNGVLHGATTALEDTEYLFICEGPILFFDENGPTHYIGWEEMERMRRAAASS